MNWQFLFNTVEINTSLLISDMLILGLLGRKAHKCNECNKFASSEERIGAHIILSQRIEEIPPTLGLAAETRARRGGQTIKKSD